MGIQIVWYKRDLRVHDHEPLRQASRQGPVVGLYLLEPALLYAPESAPRHWGFVLESLKKLREALRVRGSELLVVRGEAVAVLEDLRRRLPVAGLWSHEETGLEVTFARDRRVADWVEKVGVPWTELPQHGVVRGRTDRDEWAARWDRRMARAPRPAPERLPALPEELRTVIAQLCTTEGHGELPTLKALGMDPPTHPQQQGGEPQARATLSDFLAERGVDYRRAMSAPESARTSCSRLSPHLAYGTVGLRTVVHATRAAELEVRTRSRDGDPELDDRWLPSLRSFQSRLRWHDHFIQKLESEPELEFRCMNPAYEGLRTREEDWSAEERDRFRAWRRGGTGYPMVDACMRALSATGWLNFRMRAMLVSFAAYHLWLDWRPVARILARRFTDFEPGIHICQCQMQSGVTGINALRIYAPAKQLRDHDPEGRFVRRWVPELRDVPDSWLARPEAMTRDLQERAGCVLGRDYPHPLVEHRTAARQARERIGTVRRSAEARRQAAEVYRRHGSRKRSLRARGVGPQSRRRSSSEPVRQTTMDL